MPPGWRYWNFTASRSQAEGVNPLVAGGPVQIREVKRSITPVLGRARVGNREGAKVASGSWHDEFGFSFQVRGITSSTEVTTAMTCL